MKSKPDNNKADQEYVYDDNSAMTVKYHASRTADTHANWFLPYLQPGMTLLDVGCASGSITVGLAKAVEPGQVTAVDISEKEIERGRQMAAVSNITNVHFDVGDVYKLDFPDNSFDALFSHMVLEHISEPNKALQEMYRVLKPGGVIGIRDIDFGGYLFAPDNKDMERLERLQDIWAVAIESTGGNPRIGRHLGRLLHEAGFVEIKMSASYVSYSDFESRGFWAQIVVSRLAEPDFVERVTKCGLANVEELEAMKEALLSWCELPTAFSAHSHCEVVGRKPQEGFKQELAEGDR